MEKALEEVCRSFGVISLYVFGSRGREIADRISGRGTRRELQGSDLDVAVQPGRDQLASPRDRVALAQALEDIFTVSKVDLVILPEVNPFLAADAVRGELLYCDDEDRQAREELYYMRRAADLAPYQQSRLEGILNGELRR